MRSIACSSSQAFHTIVTIVLLITLYAQLSAGKTDVDTIGCENDGTNAIIPHRSGRYTGLSAELQPHATVAARNRRTENSARVRVRHLRILRLSLPIEICDDEAQHEGEDGN